MRHLVAALLPLLASADCAATASKPPVISLQHYIDARLDEAPEALEDAHRDNGGLWMVPGAHRSPLREEYTVDWETRSGSLRTLDETPWPDLADAVPLEVEAGSLVVFHDHMPHRSDANRSGTSRLAVTLHAHESSSEWLADNWLQRGDLPDFTLA